MDFDALRSIRIHHWKWNRNKAIKYAQNYINIVQKKYPEGINNNTYFVLPGFEHVTKYQPIIVFNNADAIWELTTTTQFIIQK